MCGAQQFYLESPGGMVLRMHSKVCDALPQESNRQNKSHVLLTCR